MSDTITATTAEKRRRLEAELELVRVVEDATKGMDLDPLDGVFTCRWVYREPTRLRTETPAVRRAAALEWLARHAKAVTAIAKVYGIDKIDKIADDRDFGVRAWVTSDPFHLCADALVPSQLTCEMVDTGRTETVPATPEQTVPVLERVCPPSIFAGVQDEVLTPDEVTA